jgi:hypothetical protein
MKSSVSGNWQRHRTAPEERIAWVRHFERSGLTRQEFARRHGLRLSTLDRWRSQGTTTPSATLPPLREVRLGPLLGSPPWIAEVQRPDGLTIRLSAAALPLVEGLLTSRPC